MLYLKSQDGQRIITAVKILTPDLGKIGEWPIVNKRILMNERMVVPINKGIP